MAVNEDYLKFIVDQLSGFGEVTTKRMFGGVGLFHQGLMFGMLGGDAFRLKVDQHNQKDYEAQGMKPHSCDNKKKGMPYWEVPVDVLENREELSSWATKSYEAALRAKKGK